MLMKIEEIKKNNHHNKIINAKLKAVIDQLNTFSFAFPNRPEIFKDCEQLNMKNDPI